MSLLTSTLVQGLTVAALIVVPLVATQTMPAPVDQLTLPDYVPIQVKPPVERGPERTRATAQSGKVRSPRRDIFLPSEEIPNGIPEGEPIDASGEPSGVDGGFPADWNDLPGSWTPSAEPEPEDDPEPIRIVGDVRPPRKIVHVNPIYPPVALAARIQGTVRLQALIDVDGNVVDLRIVESIPLLDRAAIDAVQQWRYEPTQLNGRAVPVLMTVAVEFRAK